MDTRKRLPGAVNQGEGQSLLVSSRSSIFPLSFSRVITRGWSDGDGEKSPNFDAGISGSSIHEPCPPPEAKTFDYRPGLGPGMPSHGAGRKKRVSTQTPYDNHFIIPARGYRHQGQESATHVYSGVQSGNLVNYDDCQ